MKPQEVFPTSSEISKNREYWNERSITYHGEKRYFDQVVRTGECYFCKKYGRTQNYHRQTYLHHLDYDDDEPLMWTLELCSGCHYRLDHKNRSQVARSYWKKDDSRFFVEKEMKRLGLKREEREKRDWYKSYCTNNGGKFEPIQELCPNKEFYDKVMKACEKGKTAFKKDTMSNVSRRYY